MAGCPLRNALECARLFLWVLPPPGWHAGPHWRHWRHADPGCARWRARHSAGSGAGAAPSRSAAHAAAAQPQSPVHHAGLCAASHLAALRSHGWQEGGSCTAAAAAAALAPPASTATALSAAGSIMAAAAIPGSCWACDSCAPCTPAISPLLQLCLALFGDSSASSVLWQGGATAGWRSYCAAC